jgi:hypothetical protein
MAQTARKTQFDYLNNAFKDAPEAAGGGRVPPGTYVAEVESAELTEAKSSGKPMIKWTMVVIEGDYKDSHIFMNSMIPVPGDQKETALRSLGFLKKNLKTAGVDIDAANFNLGVFLTSQLSTLQGVVMEVAVQAQKDDPSNFQTYLNRFISKPEDGGETFGGDEKEDPFKDE